MSESARSLFTSSGLPASRLFFGTAIQPLMAGNDGALSLLDSVFESGVNAFDCARSYGEAEVVLGKWMQKNNCRDQVLVLTKGGDIHEGRVEVNARVIRQQLAESLDRLQTDCIDLYLLHRDDPATPAQEMIDFLNEAQSSGQIRAFGVSNWSRNRIEEANRYAASRGLSGFAVSSPNFGLARQMKDLWGGGCVTLSGPEHAADRDWYRANQMPIVAYSGLGRGFFSGKFRAGDYDGARAILDSYAQTGYLYEENMKRLERAETLAQKNGESVPEIAMRYLFSCGLNLFAVVSTTSPARLRSNLQSASRPLSAKEVAFLEGNEP